MRQRLAMWASTAAIVAALAALVAWSMWQRWQLLRASPFPIGVDGYFYPLELRALLSEGRLAYPASPMAFYLLAPFAALTDPITGAKLGAAVYGALIAVPAYGVGARLGGSRGAGLLAAALATTSVGSAYLTAEFVKNSIGLTVALAALWMVLAAADRPTRGRLMAALAGLAAAWATHKMAAALVAGVAVPVGLAAATLHGRLRGRRLIYAAGAALLVALAALAVGAAFPHRFLAPGDADLLRGLWSTTPRWTAPALVFPDGELTMGHDALIGLLLGGVAAVGLALRRGEPAQPTERADPASPAAQPPAAQPPARPTERADPASPAAQPPAQPTERAGAAPPAAQPPAALPPAAQPPAASGPAASVQRLDPIAVAAAWPIALLAIAIGLPFLAVDDGQGLGFRLRIAAFVPMALSAAVVVRLALARMPRLDARARVPRLGARAVRDLVLAALAAVLAVARQPGPQLDGEVVTHPALVTAAQALRGRVPPGATLIVPERHIAFLVAWYTGAPIALRPERVPPAQRYRLLPLHFIRADSPLDHALMAARAEPSLIPPLGVHPGHPNGLVLVAEPTWDWVVAQLPPADRARCNAWRTI